MRSGYKVTLLLSILICSLYGSNIDIKSSVDSNIKVGDFYTREHTITNSNSNTLVNIKYQLNSKEPYQLDSSSLTNGESVTIKDVKLASTAGDRDEDYTFTAIEYDLTNKQIILSDNFNSASNWGKDCIIDNGVATTKRTQTGGGVCHKTINIEQNRAYSLKLKAKYSGDSQAQNAIVLLQYYNSQNEAVSKFYSKAVTSNNTLKELELYIPKAPPQATLLDIKVVTALDDSVTFDDVELNSYTINNSTPVKKNSKLNYTILNNNNANAPTATLGDYIWFDKNQNGIQDYSEKGIERIRVHLYKDGKDTGDLNYTDRNGRYIFDNLEPEHNYSIKVDLPKNYKAFTIKNAGNDRTKDSDTNGFGFSDSVFLKAGDRYLDMDCGLLCNCIAWIDIEKYTNGKNSDQSPGEGLIAGDEVIWEYHVTNSSSLKVKNIKVVDDKEGVINCPKTTLEANASMICIKKGIVKEGNYSNMATVTGIAENNQTVTDQDPSHYHGIKPSSIGDTIWNDKNQNGIQDAGESGVAGVKVELLDSNGDIAKDIHGNLINAVTTDSSGKYHFNNLGKGSYIVKITTPNGYIVTKKEQGNDKTKDSDIDPTTGKTDIINLDIGVDDNSWDGGIYQLNSSIDIEKSTNGEDADNTNGPEIKVGEKVIWEYNVTNRGNVKLTNIVVKDNKEGVINCPKTELNAGESMVCVKEGVAKKGKYENEAIVTAKDPTGESKSDKDPSHYYGKAPSCLGDYIWEDSNKNGIQDSNESAISGAKVELFDNSGNIAKDIDGNSITPIITNANGKYIFCNLDSGNYIVKVTPPTGFSITKKDQGTNDTKDSDIDPKTGKTTTIYLPEDTNDTKWDGGLYPNSGTGEHNHTGTACLGNYLWLDRNLNGIQDSNELGVVDIKVELYDATTNKLIARTKTDGDGKYQFCKLKPGRYKVKFALPNTYLFTLQNRGDDMRDSDVDSSGWTQVVTLEAGEKNLTLDAGIYCECDDYKIHPERYKKSSASISIFGSFVLLIFIIFATSTLKYKRD